MEDAKRCRVVFEIDKNTYDGVMFLTNQHDEQKNKEMWDQLCRDEIHISPTVFQSAGLSKTEMSVMFVSLAVASVKK